MNDDFNTRAAIIEVQRVVVILRRGLRCGGLAGGTRPETMRSDSSLHRDEVLVRTWLEADISEGAEVAAAG